MPDRTNGKPSRNGRNPRARRLGRLRPTGPSRSLREMVVNPDLTPAILTGLIMLALVTLTIGFGRDRLRVSEGRVSDETRAVRVQFQVPDPGATQRARDEQRLLTPRVYILDGTVRLELESSLQSLPAALAAAETLEDVAPEIRGAYQLTSAQLSAIRAQGNTEAEADAWAGRVETLMTSLYNRPLLASEEFQRVLEDPSSHMALRTNEDSTPIVVRESMALNVEGDLSAPMREIVRTAGFRGSLRELIEQRLTTNPESMFIFDRGETEQARDEAAANVPEQLITYGEGDLLVRRGEVIRADAYDLISREHASFLASRAPLMTGIRWLGSAGMGVTIVVALGLYLWLFYPGLMIAPKQIGGLAALIGGGGVIATWATAIRPDALWASGLTPVVLASMITVVMFDARLGLAASLGQGAILGAALAPPAGFFVALVTGVGAAAWLMREIRSRSDVVRAAVWVGIVLAIAAGLVSLVTRPLAPTIWTEIAFDVVRAGAGGFVAGAFTLVVLPSVERFFDVTTGMTLSELRDPKQPLLRELQQRAPGTFNHSHTVATLAEAGADAIGADGLHVYVGALYHDIGKMNKPDYFVENQSPGFNRHSKLSPAMSLLVIVGHVKDGVELARQRGLPKSLIGYIETHHGTTLVSYFFDQAKKKAEVEANGGGPEEIEYRYPGPKPRTREQAILMLCDAVESATRALPEPNPSRITALVHDLAAKRLMDGQFDESELTLRELRLIEDAITKALCAIYHGRIAYPKEATESAKEATPETKAAMEQTA